MRELMSGKLWLGDAGDLRDPALPERFGLRAVVHLALEELPPSTSREIIMCRFPLLDGAGNPRSLLVIAIESIVSLIQRDLPTGVFCSGGMSRSPSIAAAAMSLLQNRSAEDCLTEIITGQPHDVSPALWESICKAVHAEHDGV